MTRTSPGARSTIGGRDVARLAARELARHEEVLRPDLLRAVFSVAFDLVPHPGGRGFLVASSAD